MILFAFHTIDDHVFFYHPLLEPKFYLFALCFRYNSIYNFGLMYVHVFFCCYAMKLLISLMHKNILLRRGYFNFQYDIFIYICQLSVLE